LQILAGVSNAEVVLDPEGELAPGTVHRIPFQLTEADAGVDVILLSPYVKSVDFRLQTPNGFILEPWRAMSEPAMRYVLSNGVSYYRVVLPTQLIADRFDQGGTWHALLTIGRPRFQRTDDNHQGVDRSIIRGLHASPAQRLRSAPRLEEMTEQQRTFALAQGASAAGLSFTDAATVRATSPAAGVRAMGDRRTLPYSLIVHSYSNVSLRAELNQSSYELGARVNVRATLTQSGVPLHGRGVVWGELTRPDGSHGSLEFHAGEAGAYSAEFVAGSSGVHKLRVRARGRTRKGMPFTREQALTAVAWRGGDRGGGTGTGGGDPNEHDDRLCSLLECLLNREGAIGPEIEKRLRGEGLDLAQVRKCLAEHCAGRRKRSAQRDG
jgi:hypothetical protein